MTGQEIARRLRVSDTMISRLVNGQRMPAPVQDELPDIELPDINVGIEPEPEPVVAVPVPVRVVSGSEPVVSGPVGSRSGPVLDERQDASGGLVMGSPRLVEATVDSRYAGAMLLHGFFDLVGVAAVFTPRTGVGLAPAGSGRFDDVALLTATTVAFALGVGSVEATKHLVRAQVGPLAGLERLPELRTLRPRLGELAGACDPLRPQTDLATAMINAEAPLLNLYFVDDHFVPYEGTKPAGKGYNTKRGRAQKGLADTLVTDYHGRAACFLSGPPSGLTKTLPAALTQLRQVTGDTKITLGFDRGGACAQVFTHCRDQGVDWLTYRRGTLADTRGRTTHTSNSRPEFDLDRSVRHVQSSTHRSSLGGTGSPQNPGDSARDLAVERLVVGVEGGGVFEVRRGLSGVVGRVAGVAVDGVDGSRIFDAEDESAGRHEG